MRNAASLILVRPARTGHRADNGSDGLEVLLVQRGESGDFPGLHVFPGGLVDTADDDSRWHRYSRRRADSASQLLNADNALPFFVAAVRESLEEVGVLLANPVTPAAVSTKSRTEWQRSLLARERGFIDIVAEAAEDLATDAIGYFSHWITPEGIPRRYDTRFLLPRCRQTRRSFPMAARPYVPTGCHRPGRWPPTSARTSA